MSFLLVGFTALAPTASAAVSLGPCSNPGYQWQMAGATYYTSANSEWQGREYHVYGTTDREEVWAYNFDLKAACVGGVWIRDGANGNYDHCVNCIYVQNLDLLA